MVYLDVSGNALAAPTGRCRRETDKTSERNSGKRYSLQIPRPESREKRMAGGRKRGYSNHLINWDDPQFNLK